MIKGLSHIGIAVKNLEDAVSKYKVLFGFEVSSSVESPEMRICMGKAAGIDIEFLEPLTKDGPIAKFIENRGEGIQHLCFEVDNIYSELERVGNEEEIKLIDRQPRHGVEGLIAFLHPRTTHGVLIEFVQKTET